MFQSAQELYILLISTPSILDHSRSIKFQTNLLFLNNTALKVGRSNCIIWSVCHVEFWIPTKVTNYNQILERNIHAKVSILPSIFGEDGSKVTRKDHMVLWTKWRYYGQWGSIWLTWTYMRNIIKSSLKWMTNLNITWPWRFFGFKILPIALLSIQDGSCYKKYFNNRRNFFK
jgi:hypothetical protein